MLLRRPVAILCRAVRQSLGERGKTMPRRACSRRLVTSSIEWNGVGCGGCVKTSQSGWVCELAVRACCASLLCQLALRAGPVLKVRVGELAGKQKYSFTNVPGDITTKRGGVLDQRGTPSWGIAWNGEVQ